VVSDTTHGMALVRRVAAEHRRLLVPLGLALVVNALLYAGVVYPLSQRVANVEQRDQAAAEALAAAQREHAQASGALTGKARASAELATFYSDVLPQSLAGARRLTFLRLAQLARESNLGYERASRTPTVMKGSTLTQLNIDMLLSGTYADFRNFIYELETAPEFVVIDNVDLTEGAENSGTLNITLALSTYYRDTPP
jgi:Tfp pilus assembly protein PilO